MSIDTYRKHGNPKRRPELENFASNLVSVLHVLQKTQHEFSEIIGVDRALVSNWVGAKTNPKYEHWRKIEAVAGFSENELRSRLIPKREFEKKEMETTNVVNEPQSIYEQRSLVDDSRLTLVIESLKKQMSDLEKRVKKLEGTK